MANESALTRSILQFSSYALMVSGVIVGLFAPPIGAAMFASGAAIQAGLAITARPPRIDQLNTSPHYGIERFANPLADDQPIPILYGTHRIVPILLQEYVSPLSEMPSGLVKKQGYSALYAVCLGEVDPIDGIRGVKVNEQPLFSDVITDKFTGNGSRREWTLSGGFAYFPSISVTVGGVAKANVLSTDTTTFTNGPDTRTINLAPLPSYTEYYVRLKRPKGDRTLTTDLTVKVAGTTVLRSDATYPWTTRRVSNSKVDIIFLGTKGVTLPVSGKQIVVTFSYISSRDCQIRQTGRGQTTIIFGTAPASNAEIVATYRTSFIPRLKFEWRPGTLDQEPLEGFRDSISTAGVNLTLTKDTDRVHEPGKKCDDIRIGIVAPAGLVKFADDGSGYDSANIKIAIRYRATLSDTAPTGQWTTLYHLGAADKPSPVFSFWGMTTGKRTWEISLRECLSELLEAGYTEVGEITDVEAELESLTDARIEVQVTRKNAVLQDGNANVIDGAIFAYATRVVRDAPFSYPGVALVAIRGLVSEQFSGSSPFLTCIAERADLYDPRDGGTVRSSNAGAAIYDLITSARNTASLRYGGGHWYTEDDIDLDTLEALMDSCDESVTEGDGSTGFRRVLNFVIDTRMSLSEVVADMAYTAGAFTVQQGVRWRFPLDEDRAAQFAFVDSTDPANANIVEGSLEIGQDPLESLPTDLELEFFNEAKDYQRESVVAVAEGLASAAARNTLRVSGIGITRLYEAQRRTMELLREARNLLSSDGAPGSGPSVVTWLAHPGALLPEAGDVVSVSSTVPGGTVASGWDEQKVRVLAVGRESGTPGEDGAPAMPLVRYIGRTLGSEAYQDVKVAEQGNAADQQGGAASASGASGSAFGWQSSSLGPAASAAGGSGSIGFKVGPA